LQRYSTAQHRTVQYSTVQISKTALCHIGVLHSTLLEYCTILYCTVMCSTDECPCACSVDGCWGRGQVGGGSGVCPGPLAPQGCSGRASGSGWRGEGRESALDAEGCGFCCGGEREGRGRGRGREREREREVWGARSMTWPTWGKERLRRGQIRARRRSNAQGKPALTAQPHTGVRS